MASIERPFHNVDFWLQKLTDPDESPKDRVVGASNTLMRCLADWELKGKCPYLRDIVDQLNKLTAEQDMVQNNPEKSPREGLALQNKINELMSAGKAVWQWLQMSDAERMNICRAFDRQNCFNGHQMGKKLLERLWEVEKVEVRRDSEELRIFQETFMN